MIGKKCKIKGDDSGSSFEVVEVSDDSTVAYVKGCDLKREFVGHDVDSKDGSGYHPIRVPVEELIFDDRKKSS